MQHRFAMLIVPLLMIACGPKYIEGTKITETEENHTILDMVEEYRLAVEKRDAHAVAQLVSRRYFENASTTASPGDDYGYDKLIQKVLPVLRDNVKKVIYKVDVERIEVKGKEACVYIDWELKFQYLEGGLTGWGEAKDKNRLDLVVEDGRWKILAGL
jgi:hypothetical protein